MTPAQPPLRKRAPRLAILAGLALAALAAPMAQASHAAPVLQASTPTFARPLIVLLSYNAESYSVTPGQEFDLSFRLENAGALKARNIVVVFSTGDFIPRGTGGVVAAGVIAPGSSTWYNQPMMASPALSGGSVGTIQMIVNYTDEAGTPYTESFNISLPISSPPRPASGPIPTRTATPGPRPQLLIRSYQTDSQILAPGDRFTLSLEVHNVGGSTARRITMILGGGTSTGGGGAGTPGADGGLSGAGGDFSTFAPFGSSNVQFLGDLAEEQTLVVMQDLIVNGGAKPGAYPLRITFAYTDPRGNNLTDDQVITLLVFSPPIIDISFYRTLDAFFAGQPAMLPVQVVNLGRNSLILGRMEVTAEGVEVANNSMLIGYLDPGGYFTLDATAFPQVAGPLDVLVTVHYLDDFNQPQTISQTLTIEVQEAQVPPEGEGGFLPEQPPTLPPETFLQKLGRAVLGLLGLDSARSQPSQGVVPIQEEVIPEQFPPVPYPGTKG